jgi:hypothetical protein
VSFKPKKLYRILFHNLYKTFLCFDIKRLAIIVNHKKKKEKKEKKKKEKKKK